MNWLKRLLGRASTKEDGISVGTLSEKEIAEQQAQREAKIAQARSEAYQHAQRLQLSEVRSGLATEGLVYVGVDHADRLVLATSPSDPADTFAGRDIAPGWASFPHSQASEPYPVLVEIFGGDEVSRLELDSVPVAYPFFQPTPNGGLLIVGGRARNAEDGPEENAIVVDALGGMVTSFCIGDGVNHVQTTPSGRAWVGYHDEGVFGNYGWGNPEGPEPLGSAGLARWTLDGTRELEFEAPPGYPMIADCYSLNVVGEDAWACYYTDFPIVHVEAGGSVAAWHGGTPGVHSLAVDDDRVGLIGGYDGLYDRMIVAELGDGEVTESTTFQLAMPDDSDLPADARVLARGPRVHVLADGRWLAARVSDIPG